MKKLFLGVLALALLLSFAGCTNPKKETVKFHEKTFDKTDLSQETLEWLEWYNGLTEAEQLTVDYTPAELIK